MSTTVYWILKPLDQWRYPDKLQATSSGSHPISYAGTVNCQHYHEWRSLPAAARLLSMARINQSLHRFRFMNSWMRVKNNRPYTDGVSREEQAKFFCRHHCRGTLNTFESLSPIDWASAAVNGSSAGQVSTAGLLLLEMQENSVPDFGSFSTETVCNQYLRGNFIRQILLIFF